MRPEVEHEVQVSGEWPNKVSILRNVRLSEDLSELRSRRVRAIRVYHNNDAVLALSVDAAMTLAAALSAAVADAQSGPLGDFNEEPEVDFS